MSSIGGVWQTDQRGRGDHYAGRRRLKRLRDSRMLLIELPRDAVRREVTLCQESR